MSSPLDSSESSSPIVNYLAMDPSSSPTSLANIPTSMNNSSSSSNSGTGSSNNGANNNSGNNLQIVALSKDKYEKLVKEFQKYKQKYSKWKKVVNTEEQKWKQISLELEKKENELKTKIEENDILQFNNQRLEKRMAQLMFDLEEQLNKVKSTRQSSFFSGLFGSSETQQPKKETEVEIIKEELESKIKENESIHIHLFELKQEHEKTLAKFKHTISDLQHSIYGKDSAIHSLKTNIEENQKKFQNEKDHLKDKMRNLKTDMKSLKDSESFIRNYTYQQHEEITNLETYVNRKVLFDETRHHEFNLLNVSNFKRNPVEIELIENLIAILGNLSKCTSSTYLFIPQKIQHLNKLSNTQANIIKLLNTRMNTTIDISTFPNLFAKLIKYCELYLKYLKNDEITVSFDLTKEEEEKAQTMDKKIIFCIFKTCKEIINYKCKCLLYLTICSQLEDCQLESEEDFTQFEGFIYMRNTNATLALKYLNTLFSRFETFINTFYLSILDVEDYQVLETYLNNSQIKRVFNSLNISAGSPPNDSLNAQDFISKIKNSKSNNSSSGNFSIREECKYVLQSIKDGFKDYCDILSNLLLKENVKNFVPPFIKNINDKLIKSLSQMLGLLDNLLLIHNGLQKCEKDFTNNYSRGALVDYETILSSKVKSTNITNTQVNNSFTGNNNTINNTVFNFYYNNQESINHLRNESSNYMKNNLLNLSSSDFTMRDAEVMKVKMNDLYSLIEILKKEKEEQSIIINNLKKQNEEYKNNLKLVNDRMTTELNQTVNLVSKLNLSINNSASGNDPVESYRNYTNQSIKELIRKVNELNEKLSKQVERSSTVEKSIIQTKDTDESSPISSTTSEPSTPNSTYTKSSAISIRKPTNDKEIFSHAEISREKELEAKYTKQIEYLMRQIEVCDLKTVQYRIQYQQAIMDLEKAQDQEEKLKLKISQIQQQMDSVSEELQSSKVIYEHQIQLLSDKLVEISTNYDINSSRLNDNATNNSSTVVGGIGAAVSSFFGSAEPTSNTNERRKKNKQ
ncbi:predicted protein [Naegleria gruberi]|uniref:Predicted protein n=1 Tax=Naegleria gruberi TaxID=5762 RepID=D2VQ67_NAEGR|nr:uncharacterized protein NAEGRDRAFT_58885 [Naegleria gruberi]EFC41055.1 predicted protein [Naegleria gruberi]|eukprot:XP_002673799.1 predicted protein [Naegleria gruberi strain NEG-M]